MQTHMTPKIVGLTGGIGSGKSTARRILESLGVPCIDADIVAREIHQDPAHPALDELAAAFPHAITAERRLRRGSLRELFVSDLDANERLKAILQPHVLARLRQWTAKQRAPYVVWESALLLESKAAVDRILVVVADRTLQINRVKNRNPDWSMAQIEKMLALQPDHAELARHAHDLIHNEGSVEQLAPQLQALHRTYQQRWGT